MEEIGVRLGRFQKTDRRVQLFAKLCALVQEEQCAGIAMEIFIKNPAKKTLHFQGAG